MVAAALRVLSAASPVPELLGSLLLLEGTLIESAVRTGIEMARFREAAANTPARALEHLAEFGEDLTRTFNETLGRNPFLSGASRPLATLLFVEASTVFDSSVKHEPLAALMDIVVIKSGKLTTDEMLAGTITSELVLHEQRFVEA